MADAGHAPGSPGVIRGPHPLSRVELEDVAGFTITAKMVFVLTAGGDLYGRAGDDWYLYPPYPIAGQNDESPAEAGLSDRH